MKIAALDYDSYEQNWFILPTSFGEKDISHEQYALFVTHENHNIINAHISLVITNSQIEIMRPWLRKTMMFNPNPIS